MLSSNAQPKQNIAKSASSGVLWLFSQTVVGRVISLLAQLILAKLLSPEDFGVLGLTTTVTTIFGLLISVGVDQVLQQRGRKMHFWVTQAFWLSFVLSSVTALSMAIFAPVAAEIYNNDEIVPLILILAVSMPFQALVVVPQVRLQAELRFKFLASYNAGELLAIQCLTVVLAWIGLGAISFVIPTALMALIRALVFWRVAHVPLRKIKRVKGWMKVITRSAAILGGRISTTFISQGDYIILGLTSTTAVVGHYFFAFKLAVQPMGMLASNFTNVLFPTLTAMDGDRDRQRDAAFKTAQVLAVVTVPACFLQAAIAEPGLTLLFGNRWSQAVIFIQILSIGLPLDAPSWAAGSLMYARGEFARRSLYQTISAFFFYAIVGVGVILGGTRGVAITVSLYYVIHSMTFTYLTFVPEGISPQRVLLLFLKPFMIGFLTIGSSYSVSQAPFLQGNFVIQIVLTLSLGMLLYAIGIRLVLPELFQEVKVRTSNLLCRKKN